MTDAAHELVLGGLDLVGRELTADDYAVKAIGEGTDWGNPEPVEVAIRSLLQDGSFVSTLGHDNRTATIMVVVVAPDAAGLARGEAALFAELGRRNTLSWTPPDGWGPTTVFEVVTSSLVHTFNDVNELLVRRGYAIRLVCEPFGRSVDPVTASALEAPVDGGGAPVTPVTTNIDTCSSTTGWASLSGGAVSTGGSSVATAANSLAKLGRAAVLTSVGMLVVDWKVGSEAATAYARKLTLSLKPAGGGSSFSADQIAQTASPEPGGYTRSYFEVPAGGYSNLVFSGSSEKEGGARSPLRQTLRITNLATTNQPPTIGSPRQKFFSIDVAGSARTQGALEVAHSVDALGDTLVYTWPNRGAAYSPPLRQYLTASGTPVVDASLFSGASNDTGTLIAYDVPAAQLPDGSYLILARVKSDTVGSFVLNWTADTRFGTTVVGEAVSGARAIAFAATGVWQYVALGRAVLPPVRVSSEGPATVHVTIVADDPPGANVDLDEAWLFNTTIGALTIVNCGTGTPTAGGPSNRLWIDTATTDSPLPAIHRGTAADRSDSFHAGSSVLSWGAHEFAPGSMNVFTATDALDASVTLNHYPRWFTHAAQ